MACRLCVVRGLICRITRIAVSDDEWNAIPDVGDARNKKQRNAHMRPDRYSACT